MAHQPTNARRPWLVPALAAMLAACGGGSTPAPPPRPPGLPPGLVSGPTPVAAGCEGGSAAAGVVFPDAEVEPWVAVNPGDSNHLVAAWQQDRWTDGGARALVTAASRDGGRSWRRVLQPMSRCGGGGPAAGGDFERVSDPWVDIGPDGTVHLMGLAFSGTAGTSGANAMLASRSIDGGLSWSPPATLIADGAAFFNDKNTLTADPTDADHVYAVWDRIDNLRGGGPTWFARSTDGGRTWEPPRNIHDPGRQAQTIGNRIVVIADGPQRGTLVNLYTGIDASSAPARSHLAVIRSTDRGVTWSVPVRVAELQAVGARDPVTGVPIRDGSILAAIAVAPGGGLWVAWQDARFSAGQYDAIAVSRSDDGGLSWTAPVAINRDSGTPAFTPAVTVRRDGLVGVMHFDLRPDTGNATTLLSGVWLLTSRDGSTWSETPVWSRFDLASAPRVNAGYFLGDYHGLASTATSFLPMVALATGDTANRTDVFGLRLDGVAGGGRAGAQATHAARGVPAAMAGGVLPGVFARRVGDNIVAFMDRRLPGWSQRAGLLPEPR